MDLRSTSFQFFNPSDSTSDPACPCYPSTVYLAAVTQYVPVGKQKTERRAAFGVWMDGDTDVHVGGLLPADRPQTLKAVLIYGGAECISRMKRNGYSRFQITMESDYLVRNVSQWHKNWKMCSCGQKNASNWDEFKYNEEIVQLCRSFLGTRINWSHLSVSCKGTDQAKKLALQAIHAEDFINDKKI